MAILRCCTCGSSNTSRMLFTGPQGMPASSKVAIQYSEGLVRVTSDTAALTLPGPWSGRRRLHSGTWSQSSRPTARQKTSQSFGEDAAMLIGLSAVGNTPIGMFTGWSLPAWPATSPSIR